MHVHVIGMPVPMQLYVMIHILCAGCDAEAGGRAGGQSAAEATLQGTAGTADQYCAGAEWQHAVVGGGPGAGHLLRRPPRQ